MLHFLLAWTIALGSLGLFASGFFFPEIRRKNDLIWSGIGLFYALVMFVDSGRLRGGMILEELASVILIVWLCAQMLQQRRRLVPADKRTPIPNSMESWKTFFKDGWGRLQLAFSDPDSLELVYEEEGTSLLDISQISAAIAGLFKKEEGDRTVAPSTIQAEDEWESEPQASETSAPAEEIPPTTVESSAVPPPEVSPEEPSATTETVVEEEASPAPGEAENPAPAIEDTAEGNAEEPLCNAETASPPSSNQDTQEMPEEANPSPVETSPEIAADSASEHEETSAPAIEDGEISDNPPEDAAKEKRGEEDWPPSDPPT
jgi:hypothetical protein